MPASNHTINGTVRAIQYTGSNVSDVLTELGAPWVAYVEATSGNATFCQPGSEQFQLNVFLTRPTNWLVSTPAYGGAAPSFSSGFSILTNAQYTQQYT